MEQGECLGEGGTDEPDVVNGGRRGTEEQGAFHGGDNILNITPNVEKLPLDTDDEVERELFERHKGDDRFYNTETNGGNR